MLELGVAAEPLTVVGLVGTRVGETVGTVVGYCTTHSSSAIDSRVRLEAPS